MRIRLERIARKEAYTIGRVYVNGEYLCDSLEDRDRGLADTMTEAAIAAVKVKGRTAIPTGVYGVVMTWSPRFRKTLPLVCGVKGFEGIRVHSGNGPEDTEGCILLGRNRVAGRVLDSRVACETFNAMVQQAILRGEKITLEVV